MPTILKKKYGQNFLIDGNILNKIKQLIPYENLNILEIGPGDGRLTDKILITKPNNLTLVEIDNSLVKELLLKYSKIVEVVFKKFLMKKIFVKLPV